MAFTTSLTPPAATIKFGAVQKFTASVQEQPADTTLSYSWKVGGQVQSGKTAASLDVTPSATGVIPVEVTVTATHETNEPVVVTATANLTVEKAEITGVTAAVTVVPETPSVGDSVKVTATVTGNPSGSTISYKWETGETTAEITTVAVAGKTTFKCDITVKLANYNDFKVSRSKSITVAETPEVLEGEFHIWPLDHLNAAFMYGSWWALDEIQAVTVAGKDWKTETTFKYQNEVNGFKKILADFDTVMVQESRNGRIIDRVKLESGLIY